MAVLKRSKMVVIGAGNVGEAIALYADAAPSGQ